MYNGRQKRSEQERWASLLAPLPPRFSCRLDRINHIAQNDALPKLGPPLGLASNPNRTAMPTDGPRQMRIAIRTSPPEKRPTSSTRLRCQAWPPMACGLVLIQQRAVPANSPAVGDLARAYVVSTGTTAAHPTWLTWSNRLFLSDISPLSGDGAGKFIGPPP